MRRLPVGLSMFALMALAASCSGEPRVYVAIYSDSAGIEIVTSQGPDRTLDWRFTRVLTLGGEDEGPEAFYSLWPAVVTADRMGNLYVVDRANFRVVSFDSSGAHRWSAGKEGGGPGEFRMPVAVVAAPDGGVEVYDGGNNRVERYASDGTRLGSEPLGFPPYQSQYGYIDAGLVMDFGRLGPSPGQRLVIVSDGDTTELLAVEPKEPRLVEFPDCPIRVSMPVIFAPGIVWDAAGNRVAAAPGAEYAVAVFEGGRQTASFRRTLPLIEATATVAAREIPEVGLRIRAGSTECRMTPAQVVDARGFEAHAPLVRQLLVEPDGSVWVEHRVPDGDPVIDIFGADGEYKGTLPPDARFPVGFTAAGHALLLDTDDMDVTRLGVYRIEPN